MNKQSVQDFLVSALNNYGCKGIKIHANSVTSQCPFHWNNKNFKTFRISLSKKNDEGIYIFKCFSCQESGNIQRLVAYLYNCSFKKAYKILKKNVQLEQTSLDIINGELERMSVENAGYVKESVKLPPVSNNSHVMKNYIKGRRKKYHKVLRIDYIIKKYNLYYCDKGRYAGRIIMPIRNSIGESVAFNDRAVSEDALKSLHPEDPVYGKIIHGLFENKTKRKCVLVEGAFDMFQVDCAISRCDLVKEFGVINLMGTYLSDEKISLLVENFDELYLMLDNDEAGIKALNKYYFKLSEYTDTLEIMSSYPNLKDPGKCRASEIQYAIRNPVKLVESGLDYLKKAFGL